MTDETRRDPLNEPVPERQGVREPQPVDDSDPARDAGEYDAGAQGEFEVGDEDLGMLDRVRQNWDRVRRS